MNRKYLHVLEQLKTLYSNDLNFKNLRKRMPESVGPAIPYLDLYLSDIAFLDTCGPNVFPDGKVNFEKLHQISDKILEIQVSLRFFI